MIRDKKLVFFDNVALGNTGTAYSDVIDLGVERDVGEGREIEIDMRMRETAAGATATCQLTLQTATDEAFTTPVDLNATPAIPMATMVLGYEPARWSIQSPTNRYLRIKKVVATANFTAGKIDAAIVVDRQNNRAYPSGYTISA